MQLKWINTHFATHCNAQQHIATNCKTLYNTTTHHNTPQRNVQERVDTATASGSTLTLQHTAVTQHTATHCNAVRKSW